MKNIFCIIALGILQTTMAQVAINNVGLPPDASAMLDISSINRGLLVPRMTMVQRNAIVTPATGLMVFQTDNTPGYYYNSGTPSAPAWSALGGTTGPWLTNGSHIYYNSGRVGIGISAPKALLHIYGTGPGGGSLLAEGMFKDKPDAPPTIGAGTRLMWYPDKAAFRAGEVTGTGWDKDSIGNHSVAVGYDTKAKGITSLAIGNASSATADYAVALGAVAKASGIRSVAIGAGTIAANSWSTALGSYSIASGQYATALGYTNTAEGSYSMALGNNTTAYSMSEMVVGINNAFYTPISKTAWNPADRLFVIGNGGDGIPRNAVTVLKNGNIGIGTDMPNAALQVQESETQNGNVLFAGLNDLYSSTPGDPPASEEGSYMMWYPDKASFRAGFFHPQNIRKDSIGRYSVALGRAPTASGEHSVALGQYPTASGWASIAIGGIEAAAYGNQSAALGGGIASGDFSVAIKGNAIGNSSVAIKGFATGDNSTTIGSTIAPSFAETVIGSYNTQYTPLSAIKWNDADRLFVVGNGKNDLQRSNALTILKNGNMTVGGDLASTGKVTSGGDVAATGKVIVNGNKGIVRSVSADQMKTLEVPVVINTTISAGVTTTVNFTFPETFSSAPSVWVGNVTTGGGFAELIMSVAQVTTTGGKLFLFNPKTGSQSPSFTIKIVALGKE